MRQIKSKPKVVVICGPTGAGKTTAAIEMALCFNGRIISADSMQIYRHMNIGTAKPTSQEQDRVPHYLVDIVDPDEPFNAARFAETAESLILEFQEQGVTPFIVGGTGLYIKALVHGLFDAKPVSPDIRNRLKKEAATRGADFLYTRLLHSDPDIARRVHPNDTYRIIRALEIYEATGNPISQLQSAHQFKANPFDLLKIGLDMDRSQLYARINQRVDKMVAAGFLEEVKTLLSMGYATSLKSMQSIGYRHMVDFIQGRRPWKEALQVFKRDSRRYAKRQLAWFKADVEVTWLAAENLPDMIQLISNFLKVKASNGS